jgi:hypothetical protein
LGFDRYFGKIDKNSLFLFKRIKAYYFYLFSGVTGNVSINANGDRSADYALLDMDPTSGSFHVSRI